MTIVHLPIMTIMDDNSAYICTYDKNCAPPRQKLETQLCSCLQSKGGLGLGPEHFHNDHGSDYFPDHDFNYDRDDDHHLGVLGVHDHHHLGVLGVHDHHHHIGDLVPRFAVLNQTMRRS